nr:dihydrolipoyllysine-residue succinyltransferase component of 2-oxoglutarate dehydrogenase complex, mitochondrial [Leptinotarsa decemlineata]
MSSMLNLFVRSLSRTSGRSLGKSFNKGIREANVAPVRHKSSSQGEKIVRKYSIKLSQPIASRNHQILTPNRYFHKSSSCWDIQVIKVPPFAESVTEGDARIEKKVGDYVVADEVVMEIETDKTSMPVHAPTDGIIEEFLVNDGDTVKAGQNLFKLKAGVGPSKSAPAPKAEAPAAKAAPPPSPPPAAAPPPGENEKQYMMQFRKQHQEAFQKKHNLKLGFMSAFLKASAYALQDQPVVNAVIDGQEIIYRDYVDISVAVATPKGTYKSYHNVHTIKQVVIRPMMYVALTYDHRLIDGREAVLFLRKIKQGVEDPSSILAGL